MILYRESTSWILNFLHLILDEKWVALIDRDYRYKQLYYNDKERSVESNNRGSYSTHDATPKMERERTIIYDF